MRTPRQALAMDMSDGSAHECLKAALKAGLPTSTGRDEGAWRRLRVCGCVYAAWTCDGADEAALAPHFFSGAVDLLEEYATGDGVSQQQHTPAPAVRRFDCTPSEEAFLLQCLRNEPCIFPTDERDELWRTCRAWVADSTPDVAALCAAFPPDTVISASSAAGRTRMPLHQYVQWWQRHVTGVETPAEVLYLKDLQYCACSSTYVAPRLFADDWFGGCHDARGCAGAPDLRFVYCGPGGTATALHSDLWGSFSWSVSLCGIKRWRFVPPDDAHLLHDRWGAQLAPSFDEPALLFPRLRAARCVEVLQHAGEAMFVPSGWFHTVENLTHCLSVNCNWGNATNLHHLCAHARAESLAAEDFAGPPLHGPPLQPLLFAYLRYAVERELAAQQHRSEEDAPAALRSALTLTRAEHVLRSWPELAPGAACAELARRCRTALETHGW